MPSPASTKPEPPDEPGGRGIELIEEPTATALQTFNRLQGEGKNVAGAFHLTC